jgi:glycosyltransferase involved in cell wall biosynthesis
MQHAADEEDRRLSAVVISLEEGENLRLTVEQLHHTLPPASEIIVVDDGSTDGSAAFLEQDGAPARLIRGKGLGVAGARNLGAAEARGDVLLFLDAHMRLPEGWWEPLAALLGNGVAAAAPAVCDVQQTRRKGFGLRITGPDLRSEWLTQGESRPHPAPILPGCCLAIAREVFRQSGGFDPGMIRSQGIDNEFCLRLWLLGHECWVVPEVEVVHAFRDRHPYELRWETVLHNRLRLALTHFDQRRIACVVEALRSHGGFAGALALAADSDVLARRREMAGRRCRDADWFFERFGPRW